MKQNIVFMSIALLIFFICFTSCSTTLLPPLPENIPVLIMNKDDAGNSIWSKALYNLEQEKKLATTKTSWFIDSSRNGIQKIDWDGNRNIYHAKLNNTDTLVPFEDSINIHRHPSRASFLYKYQGIDENQQVLVYLPKSAEERGHAFVEIYGERPQMITLRPSFEEMELIHLIRPISIQKENEDMIFYFHAANTKPQGTTFLIIDAKYDGNSIQWSIVSDRLEKLSIGTNTLMEHYLGYIYVMDNKGFIHQVNVKNGRITKNETLTFIIQQFMLDLENQEKIMHMADIYNYKGLLIIKWNSYIPSDEHSSVNNDSSYALAIFFHGDEVIKTITHEEQPSLFDWIFPRQLFVQ